MGRNYAAAMFSEEARKEQGRFGSRAVYERLAEHGPFDGELGDEEIEFIQARDSFYLASVTPDGWPYVQHRGGPPGFLLVESSRRLAFAEYGGNRQYITFGNLAVHPRVSLFLMDYPHQTRLKLIGHASMMATTAEPELTARLPVPRGTRPERVMRVDLVGFDWNCTKFITPRYSLAEIEHLTGSGEAAGAGPVGA